ncbi:GntP family transporter [Serratia proteamaculans]|jgi:GntP family gluconate:H+ symporter|uniref:GntP family transporter n=1 Tax=Serratia proteamaculans TaxID=28151 RepID=UPI000D8182E1|nr:GntP family transporter [Serratia proteamaculans]SPZ53503.1 Inner membrane permease ygbN [Serratia quinivorans]NWA73557.1 GntP family transporter [Serratia proteamaculans]CAI0887452.1 Inner membrane permease ygbN [Serratia proteamaculans]CAI0943939.1 Inner membrane permease ygbN [Serratia proteamaculans]CAI0948020.1 Inner membrane permease ygbN [Serratia proteamaculans]
MSTSMLLMIAVLGVVLLLLMVIKAKIQPFVALLVVSLLVALASGIPTGEVMKVMTAGMGGVLGSVTIIIGLGAMLGRMIEHSGGAESLAQRFSKALGPKRTVAALTIAAFILGIPVFFDVGFIILAPIIYGFAKVAKVSPLKFGLPMAGVMLTVHVALPPHPGPVAAAGLLNADIGWLTIIGLAICIPVGVIGYFTAKRLNRKAYPLSIEVLEQLQLAAPEPAPEGKAPLSDRINPPGAGLVAALIVIPIAIIMLGTVSATLLEPGSALRDTLSLIGSPAVALMIALLLAFYFLAIRRGWSLQHTSDVMGGALPTAAVVILVTGAGGVFGKVLVESGVGKALADVLTTIGLPLIPAAFIISLALRASQGSATVAILTTGGLLSEAVSGLNHLQLVLVTLATCFGGLGLSHVNDSGFWIVTKYLGLSVADGLKTWTVLTTILGISGFLFTWLLWLAV